MDKRECYYWILCNVSHRRRREAGLSSRLTSTKLLNSSAMNTFLGHARPYENLAKRDDNYRPERYKIPSTWRFPRFYVRKRRLILFILAIVIVWLIWSFSSANEQDNIFRNGGNTGRLFGLPKSRSESIQDQRNYDLNDPSSQFYAGSINLPELTDSLYSSLETDPYSEISQSVLFAASNLSSISRLLPLACEMARRERNFVHFVILSRESLPLKTILEINGVYTKHCPMFTHDGRPDNPEHSTDKRARSATRYAVDKVLYHVQPRAVITDDFLSENSFFTDSIVRRCEEYETTLIQIPKGDIKRFFWMSRMDGGSLSAWHKSSVDILVPVQSGSAGSLNRLFNSLKTADYSGFRMPRLILELPAKVDSTTREILDEVIWPPDSEGTSDVNSGLILRHRVLHQAETSKEASLNFLESFWPTHERNSHVLLLTPRTELSPLFYHYLHYASMTYRYTLPSKSQARSLLGIALDAPIFYSNVTNPSPQVSSMSTETRKPTQGNGIDSNTPFLWGSPNMNALIFGDKWKELHSFVGLHMVKERTKSYDSNKLFHDPSQPPWIEYLLKLMRARGYTIFHPSIEPPSQLAVTNGVNAYNHQLKMPKSSFGIDESEMPPSLLASIQKSRTESSGSPLSSPSLSSDNDQNENNNNNNRALATSQHFLHDILSPDGELPKADHLPIISHQGKLLSWSEAKQSADDFADWFRREIGGCPASSISDADVGADDTLSSSSALADSGIEYPATPLLKGRKGKSTERKSESALDLFCFIQDDDGDGDDEIRDHEDFYMDELY